MSRAGPDGLREAPHDRRAVAALIERLAGRHAARMAALRALKRLGGRAVPSLVAALEHDDVGLRAGAVLALGQLRRESLVPLLVAQLKARPSAVRFAARRALMMLDARAAELLRPYLTDRSARVRAAIAAILRSPEPQGGVRRLRLVRGGLYGGAGSPNSPAPDRARRRRRS